MSGGGHKTWQTTDVADVAGEMYWHNRLAPAVEDVAA